MIKLNLHGCCAGFALWPVQITRIGRVRGTMPKGVRKSDLPEKTCVTCLRPFTWRKKWEKVWDEVRYCSDKCRAGRGKVHDQSARKG